MTHKKKVRLAKSIMTQTDRIVGRPPFLSDGWQTRKAAIAKRVKNRTAKTVARRVAREEAIKKNGAALLGRSGGLKRAVMYTKEQLSNMGKKGGRPKKQAI